jgi:flagellar motility protein MotE (MotC chaperone)
MPENNQNQAGNIEKSQGSNQANQRSQDEGEQTQVRPPSKIYLALSRIVFLFLLFSLAVAVFLSVLTLDFLEIYPFRYRIPEEYRKYWPLAPYYNFVQLHQLPEEERYQQLMLQEQERFNKIITEGSRDLEARAKTLEESYRTLMRTQKEQHQRELEDLRKQRETFELEKKKLADEIQDLENRKVAIDELSQRLASETLNIESSLIRFMEKENRLDQVRSIAAQMESKSIARIFDEVPDDQLIYDILGGLMPSHSGKILGNMDPEKAGRILKLGQIPLTLPDPGPSRNYIPPSLQNLINDTQANLR